MKICLDPGHGGPDTGARGPGPEHLEESAMTLDVCKRARDLLLPYCEVIMTRDDDEYVGLTARAEYSNREGCDAFISCHFNAATTPASGFEVFTTPGANNSDKLAACIWARHRAALPTQIDRGLKEANFTVIRKAACPAILVEHEFIHTQEGASFIGNAGNRQRMAEAIAGGVMDYFSLEAPQVLTLEDRVVRIEKHLGIS
jgi:N-acetylmuramoyl-L-alanine amidase